MNLLGYVLDHYTLLASALFAIGAVGFLVRRNTLIQLMSIELMLNAVNLALVAYNRMHDCDMNGQMFAFFIIAVAAEEYGLILVLIVIALYTLIVVRSLMRLMRERDMFIRLAGTGLACMFGVQAMINMGVAVRLLPAKGMTLPFVSYGGSSLIAGGIAVREAMEFETSQAIVTVVIGVIVAVVISMILGLFGLGVSFTAGVFS